jgi:formylglycine-generating enzyme required for sulfatase activity
MKFPNELGIYDMSGNVWEWCSDWYAWDYLTIPQTNPIGPETGSNHVIRGGSNYLAWYFCMVQYRAAGFGGGGVGLRLVHP